MRRGVVMFGWLVVVFVVGIVSIGCRSNRSAAAVEEADKHMGIARSALCRATAVFWQGEAGSDSKEAIAASRAAIALADKETAASRAAIASLPDSAGRKHYLAAIDKSTETKASLSMAVDIVEAWRARDSGIELLRADAGAPAGPRSAKLINAALGQFAKSGRLFRSCSDTPSLPVQKYIQNADLWNLATGALVRAERHHRAGEQAEAEVAASEWMLLAERATSSDKKLDPPELTVVLVNNAVLSESAADELHRQALRELGVGASKAWVYSILDRRVGQEGVPVP